MSSVERKFTTTEGFAHVYGEREDIDRLAAYISGLEIAKALSHFDCLCGTPDARRCPIHIDPQVRTCGGR